MPLNDTLREQVGMYLEMMLAFNSIDHDLIWKYIIVVASQLEYLTIHILLVHDCEDPNKFWEYEERTTLNQAVKKLKEKKILSSDIHDIINAIANLRNSVLHRKVLTGITEYAVYKGRKVFYDPDAFQQLTEESTHAIDEINAWLACNK